MKRSLQRPKHISSKQVYPEIQFFRRNWLILIIILFIANFAIKRAVDLRFFAQSCMSNTQIQNDTRCLYIYNGNVYEKGSRSNPHHGHACGSNVTQLLSTVPFHLNNMAVYLDPNLVGSVCPAQQPTPTPTAAVPSVTPLPTVIPSATPTRIPSPTPTPIPTLVPSATPSTRPTPTLTIVPTRVPTASPIPTTVPTTRPTPRPTVIPTQPSVPTPTPPGGSYTGDLNNDGCIDQKDIQIFLKTIREHPKNPSLDLNGNKKIDFGDLYAIMENEGKGCKRNPRTPWWRRLFRPFERDDRDDY